MCQWPPCAAVLLAVVSLYLVVLTSCQSIEAFDDSSCLTPASNMVPSIISFDAAKPECLLIRDETTLPLVDSFDVDFYASSEQCSAGVPIVVSYSNSYRPVTPMPIIPSPVSTRNMSFCFQSGYRPSNGVFEWSRTTTSRKLTMAVRSSTVPGARFSKGLAGRRAETFLCSLTPGSTLFSTPEDAQPDYQSRDHPVVMKYKSFIQYLGPTIKYGLQMFVVNQSEIVQYQQLQSTQVCEADTCCTTGSGPATIHFRVNKSSVQYKSVTKAYGKVISCNSGNLMYQTYSDAKCTVGRNAPKVLRADGSCQMTPMPSQLDDGADADYGYGTYFKGRCQTSDVSPPAKSSVLVTAFSDASCSQPNIDIKPSPINCGTSQCCLIAKRSGVNYLDGGVLQLFSSSVDCQNNITAHPLSLPANSPGFSYNHQELLKVLNITGFPPGLVAPASDHWQCVQDCQTNFPNSLSDCHCPLWQFGRDSRYFGRIFSRKPRMFRCFQNMDYQTNFNSHSMGYFAQYLGNGKWNFDIRMFQDYDCKQPIFIDTSVPSDRMCAVDTCCKVGNSSASFFFRIPSSTLKFDNKARDVYARLLSCNGDVAMFHQYEDNACSIYDQGDLSVMLPRVLRADGSCAAVPSTEYAIDSFYTAKCSLPTPLVKSVSVKAYSDATCSAPSSSVQPQTITCQINECCIVRQATESNAAVYGRAVSCDSQAMLFNTYSDSRCIVANQYMPMALRSDDSCQVDQTGYTQFYRASCKILPKPPASPPSETLLCPKDLNGNVCGGAEFGSCSAVYSASGYRIPVCICVQDTGFFNGQICTSAAAQSSVAGLVNKTFWRQQEQAGRLNALSCADPVKPVKCPNSSWVPQQNFGQCQTSMSACASNSAAFRTYVESQALLCPEKTSFDSVLMQCVPANAPRTPVFSCPPTMMRCSDGSCDTAANCASVQAPACPSGSTGSYLCPGNRVACAASLSECSKKEPWNGCPVNQLQCPNRPGVCAASLQDCSSVPGPYMCPDPLLPTWCGHLRNVAGTLVLDAGGKAQSKCVAQSAASSCPPIPNVSVKAVAKTLTINANSAASVAVLGSDNKPMATLDIPATLDSDVSFVISPVSDSVYQAGAFKKLFLSGKLRSPLISISPSAIVDTRSGGISLTLSVDVPSDQCINATSNMQGFAVSEEGSGDSSSVPSPMSSCSGLVQDGQCKCTFVVTHFSTFAVGDAVNGAVSARIPYFPSLSSLGAPDIAAIAGGIAGGIVFVVFSAFLFMKAKMASVHASSQSSQQKPAGTEMQQVGIDGTHP